jgi:hypothetical protein
MRAERVTDATLKRSKPVRSSTLQAVAIDCASRGRQAYGGRDEADD